MDFLNPLNAFDQIRAFVEAGGNVLLVIMIVTFVMWALILERLIYFFFAGGTARKHATKIWSARSETKSWYAHAVRDKLISEVKLGANQNMTVIKGLVTVTPLLGLLGTVTGMVEVFDVMAVTGSSNARLMAAGISKATIPTMAGLVASLSGILMTNVLERFSEKSVNDVSDKLVIN